MNSPHNPPPELADAPDTVRLPANGTTVSAEELRVQLVLALDTCDAVTVDAGEVESIGQAVLQLLVAARAEAQAAEKPLSIINPTPAFAERVACCRLADAIGLELEGAEA